MKKFSRDVLTINFNMSLQQLINDTDWKKVSSAIVVDDFGEVFGVITDSDIAYFEQQGRSLKSSLAWELCSHKLLEADVDTPVEDVARLMLNNNVHHVIVTVGDKKAAGIISALDVIDELIS